MHTKGPWELQKITGGYRIITGGKYTMNLDGPWYPSAEQLEAFEANARLIAAAPELLEACTIAFDLLTDLTTDEFSRGLDRPARLALGKAIRKAKDE